MNRRGFISQLAGAAAPAISLLRAPLLAQARKTPNVVVILADDVGYGDLSCYGATKVRTPNLDRLAASGVRFTDAHSSSATCTPTRYSLMTGEYAWRKKGTGILPGDAALIIEPGRTTLPSVFRSAGYRTGCVGKWHLGLGSGNIDWNGEIKPGPLEVGFDYSFIIPATGDRVPCVFVENHRVAGLDPKDPIQVSYAAKVGSDPTGKERPDLLKMKLSHGHDQTIVNGISRIGYMSGGKSARWVDENIARTLASKANSFIDGAGRNPFFLYLATHDIHVPRVPEARFQNQSQCGRRCDAIAQLDWTVGEVLAQLDRNNLSKDTMVIFTSDNGPVIDDGYADGSVENLNGHRAAGALRGGKYSIYEGGTRMPFIVRWPAHIKPGVSNALVGQYDMVASFANMLGQPLKPQAAPDSYNVLPALLGESQTGRDHLVEHAEGIALREGNWKLVPGADKPAELYDLASDIGETRNLAGSQQQRVQAMTARLEKIRSAGRSRS
jgi:arylsulfatase A-like enzyme